MRADGQDVLLQEGAVDVVALLGGAVLGAALGGCSRVSALAKAPDCHEERAWWECCGRNERAAGEGGYDQLRRHLTLLEDILIYTDD